MPRRHDANGGYELKRTAFTLIELLVVIAIIAILAAILFPVFAQAKAAAKKTSALSNLKQNALAVLMYNNDNDDTFAQSAYCLGTPNGYVIPGSNCQVYSAYDAIYPYTKNKDIYLDPADPKSIPWKTVLAGLGLQPFQNGASTIEFASSALNFAIFEDPGVGPTLGGADPVFNAGAVSVPAETAMFFSARYVKFKGPNDDVPEARRGDTPSYYQPGSPFSAQNFAGTARHSESILINFVDGHAKSFKKYAGLPGMAPDTNWSGSANVIQVYNLPYDVNGVPDVVAEGKP